MITDIEQAALLGTVHHQQRQQNHQPGSHEVHRPAALVEHQAGQVAAGQTACSVT